MWSVHETFQRLVRVSKRKKESVEKWELKKAMTKAQARQAGGSGVEGGGQLQVK
jgi:hypothetical protein